MGPVLEGMAGSGRLHLRAERNPRRPGVEERKAGRYQRATNNRLARRHNSEDPDGHRPGWDDAGPVRQFFDRVPTNTEVRFELRYLASATRERTDAMGEITGQATEFLTYFMDLMAITPASHPNTVRLMNIASLIALYTCLYWKGYYKRMRPVATSSGADAADFSSRACVVSERTCHAVMACRIVHAAGIAGLQPESPAPSARTPGAGSLCAALTPGLTELAMRIARNREIAGLHYPTDSVGGRTLASKLFSTLLFDDSRLLPSAVTETC